MKLLNCEKPSIILRVTQHVPQIVEFIKKLIDSNYAYVTASGSVYFDTQKFAIKSFFEQTEATTEFDSKGGYICIYFLLHKSNIIISYSN